MLVLVLVKARLLMIDCLIWLADLAEDWAGSMVRSVFPAAALPSQRFRESTDARLKDKTRRRIHFCPVA